ncbi:Membrane-associated protein in eicosanoid and glutathione metabolism (MAPEG) [Balamuthia mandrillaris]
MAVGLLCSAILGLMIFILGLVVSLTRAQVGQAYGYPNDPASPLHQRVRAHANHAEYAPALMAIMLYLEARGTSSWWMSLSMLAVTLSRVAHVLGLTLPPTMAKGNPLRFIGALGTYVFGSLLCLAVLVA